MKRNILIWGTIACLLILSACHRKNKPAPKPLKGKVVAAKPSSATDKDNGTMQSLTSIWLLTGYRNLKTNQLDARPTDTPIDALILELNDDGKSGTVQGKTTSNQLNGQYKFSSADHRLKFGEIISTKVAERGWGSDLLARLRDVERYDFRNGRLLFINADQTFASEWRKIDE